MSAVLFINQDHRNPPGILAGCFTAHGYDVEQFNVVPHGGDPRAPVTFPDPRRYDAIVALGADFSVTDPGIGPWLGKEMVMLRAAHDHQIPVLGVCFGSQVLALALDGTVSRARLPEIGWHEVETDEPQVIEAGPWFCWHEDGWTAPPGARVLARNRSGPQAFALGTSLGVQFHPEASVLLVASWLSHDHKEVTRIGIDGETLISQTRQHDEAAASRAGRLVDAFLERRHLFPERLYPACR
jgi:GMP synthase-like glutamine amidotransferase